MRWPILRSIVPDAAMAVRHGASVVARCPGTARSRQKRMIADAVHRRDGVLEAKMVRLGAMVNRPGIGHIGREAGDLEGGDLGVERLRAVDIWIGLYKGFDRMDVVAVRGAVDDIMRDAHRVDADRDRCADLDAQLDADIATSQEILELHRLTLRQTDVDPTAFVRETRHGVGIIESEPAPQLGDGDVRPRCDESAEARGARPFAGCHGYAGKDTRHLPSPPGGARRGASGPPARADGDPC
ncbi:MAG: hypothetical protein ABI534_00075 [Chloroflexota bacterium]